MVKFRYLENIAIADLAFEAFGKNMDELFENAGMALETAQAELEGISAKRVHKVKIEASNLETLLFSFLEELIFLKDTEQFLAGRINCQTGKSGKKWRLEAKLSGEKINPAKHKLGVDVKAVTKHLFEIKKLPQGFYRCRAVLDV